LNFRDTIDLDKLREILCGYDVYKCLANVPVKVDGTNTRRNSILLMNSNDSGYDRNDVIHLYMVKEPDMYGNWKIYGIEREI